jgi:AraC-like DNA-binding protein
MPRSTVTTFADPSEFQEAIRSAEVEALVTARGAFRAELTHIDLHKLSIQRGRETLPRVGRGAMNADRAAIYFLIGADQEPGHHSGVEFSPGEIVINHAASTYHHVTSAFCRWGDVSLTWDDLAAGERALAGGGLTPSPLPQILRPQPALMSRLLNLHEAAGSLARTAPDILVQSEVARALEQALIHAMIACMTDAATHQHYVANRYHRTVLARFEQLLAEKANAPLHLAEICAAIGTPERTLRVCCQEHLGMGPIRYLWLRRMHLARQALLEADAESATVTSIATGQGFWELGKFSVAYRSLFGESPAVTLRRSPDQGPVPSGSPFTLPAAVSA